MYANCHDSKFHELKKIKWNGRSYNIKNIENIVIDDIKYNIYFVSKNKYEIILLLKDCCGNIVEIREKEKNIGNRLQYVVKKEKNKSVKYSNYSINRYINYEAYFLWYTVIMVGSLIFKDWLIVWIFASIIFIYLLIKK